MQLQPPPYYRMWIYSVNGLIICLQILFLVLTQIFISNPRSRLFPITFDDPTVILMYIAHSAQFLACFLGILGVFRSYGALIRIYWLLMFPIIITDLIRAILWSLRFQHIHQSFARHLAVVVAEQVNSPTNATTHVICEQWSDIQTDLRCCAPVAIARLCSDYGSSWLCCKSHTAAITACTRRSAATFTAAAGRSCESPLLRWLHSQVDVLGVIAYFALVPLKLIVVFVLRVDIHELFSEIFYADNHDLYRHWANDPMDDTDSSQRSDHDSNQSLLLGPHKVFGG